jgi:hypothetical protein
MDDPVLQFVVDTRKFEIELYWKRAGYFWTFIAATFGAYLALLSRKDPTPALAFILVGCLGYLFSLAWYCANRGSKYWQTNWEAHLDRLEPLGSVYRTNLDPSQFAFWRLTGPYAFSVSRINQLLSLLVTALWFGLLVVQIATSWPDSRNDRIASGIVVGIGVLGTVALLTLGRTGRRDKGLRFKQRTPEYAGLEPRVG